MTNTITDAHRSELACVYARQSSLNQVRNNCESTERQRNLVMHAERLGWKPSRIVLIDEDLGCSGTNMIDRLGYQRLVKMVKKKEVGLILATEMSRLGRDHIEWQILIRYCSFANVLLGDEQRTYDPNDPNDQIVLGLMGAFAEYELSHLRKRMYESLINKAKKGEVHCSIPAGYILCNELLVKDPNLRVQHAIETILEKFTSSASAGELTRWCCDNKVEVPSYVGGKGRGVLCWQEATTQRIVNILKNPTLAGAYVFGRRKTEKYLEEDGQVRKRIVRKPKEQWMIVIQDHHEAYISWAQFEKNLQRLEANNPMAKRDAAGAAHKGEALLAGLLRCRECGNKLQVGYSSKGAVRYICRNGTKQRAGRSVGCFSFQGKAINHLIAEEVLAVVEPAGVEASFRACDLLEAENTSRGQALSDKVEQYKFEADRAFRQFDCSDPENRLVTGELEKRWNKCLVDLSSATSELEFFEQERQEHISPEEREALLLLGKSVKNAWFNPASSMILKKQIVRELVEEIVVTVDKKENLIRCWIHWSGGQHTPLQLPLKTRKVTKRTDEEDPVEIIKKLREIVDDSRIVQILNRAGIKRKTGASWTKKRIEDFRQRHGIPAFSEKEKKAKQLMTQQEAANRLEISPMSVLRLIRTGVISAKQVFSGSPWIIKTSALEKKIVQRAVENIKKGSSGPLTENPNQLTLW